MKTANFLTSSCRHCRYFNSEGRRGGMCQQLDVRVESHWKACAFATHPFKTPWEHCEEVVQLEKSFNLTCLEGSETSTVKSSPLVKETKEPATI